MSSVWKKPNSTPRQQENAWMNLLWNSHDQFCNCDDPLLHFMVLVNRDGNYKKPVSDIENIKCLLTGPTTEEEDGTKEEEDHGFEPGDLEKLFAENGEDIATEDTPER